MLSAGRTFFLFSEILLPTGDPLFSIVYVWAGRASDAFLMGSFSIRETVQPMPNSLNDETQRTAT